MGAFSWQHINTCVSESYTFLYVSGIKKLGISKIASIDFLGKIRNPKS